MSGFYYFQKTLNIGHAGRTVTSDDVTHGGARLCRRPAGRFRPRRQARLGALDAPGGDERRVAASGPNGHRSYSGDLGQRRPEAERDELIGRRRERGSGDHGRTLCSRGIRRNGRGSRTRPDGDDPELEHSGGRRETAARFNRLGASHQALLEEEKEELASVLVVVFNSSEVAGNDGERRRQGG